jgi:hypothetical protein
MRVLDAVAYEEGPEAPSPQKVPTTLGHVIIARPRLLANPKLIQSNPAGRTDVCHLTGALPSLCPSLVIDYLFHDIRIGTTSPEADLVESRGSEDLALCIKALATEYRAHGTLMLLLVVSDFLAVLKETVSMGNSTPDTRAKQGLARKKPSHCDGF